MATYTLHRLINIDPFLIEYYQNAKNIWTDIKNGVCFESIDLLAKELSYRQCDFERKCGGKCLGQEIMATYGIGQYYTLEVGFDAYYSEAVRVYEAFDRSYCSVEVKLFVNEISKILHLEGVALINI